MGLNVCRLKFSSPKDWDCKPHSHDILQILIFDLNTMDGCPKHQYIDILPGSILLK